MDRDHTEVWASQMHEGSSGPGGALAVVAQGWPCHQEFRTPVCRQQT